jgi:hypothetical protein
MITIGGFTQDEYPTLPIDSSTKLVSYTEVVKLDTSANRKELFSRAREWFAKTYKSSTVLFRWKTKKVERLLGKL